jgi:hypothetical protein
MPFLQKSGDEDDERSQDVAAGAPPGFGIDFDPNDPDQVKVHYDLAGWSLEQRAELAETLAEREVPHVWEGEELVVPEEIEDAVDALFDELEQEIGPFPVLLDGEGPATEFGLDEWSRSDIEMLEQSLVEAEIPHRWQGTTLFVSSDAEHVVDDLLDAIEAGEVASLDEEAIAPDGALQTLYVSADRLRRDPTNTTGREQLLALVPKLSPTVPPFGLPAGSWAAMVEAARRLAAAYQASLATDEIREAAAELYGVCRPWV